MVDRQEFLAARDQLTAKIRELETRLSSESLTADELARVPHDIGEARASLAAIEARISLFEIEDIDKHLTEAESAKESANARLKKYEASMKLIQDEWMPLQFEFERGGVLSADDIKRAIKVYSENLEGAIAWRLARNDLSIALMDEGRFGQDKKEATKRRAQLVTKSLVIAV